MPDNDKFIEYANIMADSSSAVIEKYFRQKITTIDKEDSSPVTIADKETEKVIRDIIEKNFPTHGIIGEEFGSIRENSSYVWVIDPIDGTKAFISGIPTFGTLVALLKDGKPILGMINQPISKERWLGVTGESTLFNNKTIKTRNCKNLNKAILSTTSIDTFDDTEISYLNKLKQQTKMTVYGADCYAYGQLASGFIDIICETSLKLHDFAALVPIINGAGGVITDWQGNDLTLNSKGQVLALGDKFLLNETLDIFKG